MAILRCKMCGGEVNISEDKTFGTCDSCGNAMTFPKVSDEQRAAAFNRGNHFRRIGEFDKALAVYERIVGEDETDAEAHWCCALCRFGIEYVEDPSTMEWLPTCHRASYDSFLDDVDYQAALEHSDGVTRRQYQKDAAKIAEVQKGILAASQGADPYDVFICYKESDELGQRTRDSLLAQDIYYQLTEQGRKVFFARITLENMVGKQYEPYIFSALNSAKVMVVVGTKAEYLNAVWVKNEWSRFLAMMKKDHSKLLLPCYRDMDPYDMPEQLSVLQSYDMSKIGFIQDLIRGIAKVLDVNKPVVAATTVAPAVASQAMTLVKRGMMALEDVDWAKADNFFEEALNQDAECAPAYLGKLLCSKRVRQGSELGNLEESFEEDPNFKRAHRFASPDMRQSLERWLLMAKANEQRILEAEQRRKAEEEERKRQEQLRREEERAKAEAARQAQLEAERQARLANREAYLNRNKALMMIYLVLAGPFLLLQLCTCGAMESGSGAGGVLFFSISAGAFYVLSFLFASKGMMINRIFAHIARGSAGIALTCWIGMITMFYAGAFLGIVWIGGALIVNVGALVLLIFRKKVEQL